MENYDVLVVGSGAAGFAVANRIRRCGNKSVAVITENINGGTSRNTGSDKQTYYKLNLSSEPADSVMLMAQNLFDGGCVDGDVAYCEAASSAPCFLHLAELGVPFPKDEYGTYTGYKTDHDPFNRASGAGPYTSKYMTEALEKQARDLGVPLLNHRYVTKILTHNQTVVGLTVVNTISGDFEAFRCRYIVLATGGSSAMFYDTVYPDAQQGSASLALNAGCRLQNLTEWQFGLASVHPKWNVSGSYMQVLPRFISVDDKGNAYEFLSDYFDSIDTALTATFLKGYQWPFDCKKAKTGSSKIDLAVYTETKIKHRRVFLDFTKNPFGIDNISKAVLSEEAYSYLSKANALTGKPIDRLKQLNTPAYELYFDKGVDLSREYLEIALCAQHQNGGISVNAHWQTDIQGLFAVGECAGTHGITRPGGSALNAGQVGALRAAEAIDSDKNEALSDDIFEALKEKAYSEYLELKKTAAAADKRMDDTKREAQQLISRVFGAVRLTDEFETAIDKLRDLQNRLPSYIGISSDSEMAEIYRLQDILLTQIAYALSVNTYIKRVNASRGSAVYVHSPLCIFDDLKEPPNDYYEQDKIQTVRLTEAAPPSFQFDIRATRPLPVIDTCFENVWRQFRESTTDTAE